MRSLLKQMAASVAIFSLLITSASPALAGLRVVPFNQPDIKNEFCGVHINFQYCKCAFHNQYCGSIGMDQGGADGHVQSQFGAWVAEKKKTFAESCEANGGKMKGGECNYCDAPEVWKGSNCVEPEAEEPEEEEEEEEEAAPEADDCGYDEASFDDDWEKYSDIDDAIPVGERSFEAQQYHQKGEELIQKVAEAFAIEHDMELDRQARLAMREFRQAVVNNIKTNLLKAFWRLTYITYSTIKSGKGLGESYTNVLTATEASAPVIGEGIGLVQSLIPADSQLALDTSTDVGKIRAMTLGAELEALKSGGNPVKVATQVMTDIAKLPIPSVDLSKEEIAILSDQKQLKDALDDSLQESYKKNALRRQRLQVLEEEIEVLRTEVQSWEAKEKDRVARTLQAECEEEEEAETSWFPSLIPTVFAHEGENETHLDLGGNIVEFNRVLEVDKNVDGRIDRWSYYVDEQLVGTAYDTDADGKRDLWLHYNEDRILDLEGYDTDGDGSPDQFIAVDENEQAQEVAPEAIDLSQPPVISSGSSNKYLMFGGIAVFILALLGFVFLRRRE